MSRKIFDTQKIVLVDLVDRARPGNSLNPNGILEHSLGLRGTSYPGLQIKTRTNSEEMALCDTLEQQIDATTAKQTELLNAVMAQVS